MSRLWEWMHREVGMGADGRPLPPMTRWDWIVGLWIPVVVVLLVMIIGGLIIGPSPR